MNPITLPYHLLLPCIICVFFLSLIFLKRKYLHGKTTKWAWMSVTLFLIIYATILGIATSLDIYYQWNLNNFDLNKDGFFSGKEITEAQKIAMNKLVNDTGRNFSIIIGFLFALIPAFTLFVWGILFNKKSYK